MIKWVCGVVVSRFLRKEKASGSIPDTSIFFKFKYYTFITFFIYKNVGLIIELNSKSKFFINISNSSNFIEYFIKYKK